MQRDGFRARIDRRAFLRGAAGLSLLPLAGVAPGLSARESGAGFAPEHERPVRDLLFVWDPLAPESPFRELIEIVHALPPEAAFTVLSSEVDADDARRRLERAAIAATCLAIDRDVPWAWGRDALHLGWVDRKPAVVVPCAREAARRGDLAAGHESLRRLLGPAKDVRLGRLAFEGGNLAVDVLDGARTLFVGNSVILETIALHGAWFEGGLGPKDVADLLATTFGVERVVPLGRTEDGAPVAQASLLFHIDLAVSIVSRGVAIAGRIEAPEEGDKELREDVEADVVSSSRDDATRRRTEELLAKEGIRPRLPRTAAELRRAVDEAVRAELARLRAAAAELDAIGGTLRGLGYTVHDLPFDWRRLRRGQSHANALVSSDRVLYPVFPAPGKEEVRAVMLPGGRRVVEVLRYYPGPDAYRVDVTNRAAGALYRRLRPEARPIEDVLYLSGGGLHRVAASLG